MKKHFLPSSLLLLSLLASCNMNGMGLFADGDSDDGIQNNNDQETDFTSFSAVRMEGFRALRVLGYSQDKAFIFSAVLEIQINAGKPKEWAAAYAVAIIEGKSPQEAALQADNKVHSPVYMQAYQRAIEEKGKKPEGAKLYAKAYQKQINAGRSPAFAEHYATRIAQKDGSMMLAYFYAKKRVEGKSKRWANAYAVAIVKTQSSRFATRVADSYTTKVDRGIPKPRAIQEAYGIAEANTPVDINAQEENGDTGLIKAVRDNAMAWAEDLLRKQADCNIQNHEGRTALMIATEQGNAAMVALLLDVNPTSTNIKAQLGTTALTWARKALQQTPRSQQRKIQRYLAIIKMLQLGVSGRENALRRLIRQFLPGATGTTGAATTTTTTTSN